MFDRLLRQLFRVGYQLQLAWWRIRHPALRGAAVAVWYAGRVLVVRNSYRSILGLPAGGVRRREEDRAAAVRELREEVGIVVPADALEYVGEFLEVTHYVDDHVHIYELRCEDPPQLRVDGREVVWADFMEPDEVIDQGTAGFVRSYLRSYLENRR